MSAQEAAVSAPFTPVEHLRSRGRLRGVLPFLGPAFVAAISSSSSSESTCSSTSASSCTRSHGTPSASAR